MNHRLPLHHMHLAWAIRRLSFSAREMLMMRHIGGMTLREIGEKFGRSAERTRQLIDRAERNLMRTLLEYRRGQRGTRPARKG